MMETEDDPSLIWEHYKNWTLTAYKHYQGDPHWG